MMMAVVGLSLFGAANFPQLTGRDTMETISIPSQGQAIIEQSPVAEEEVADVVETAPMSSQRQAVIDPNESDAVEQPENNIPPLPPQPNNGGNGNGNGRSNNGNNNRGNDGRRGG